MSKLIAFTEEQGKDLTDFVEQQGLSRLKAGTMVSEGDFYAGAASAIQFMFEDKDAKHLTRIIPPMWILGIMSNRSPSTRWEEDEETKKRLERKVMRSEVIGRYGEQMYDFVETVLNGEPRDRGLTPNQWLNELRVMARLILEDIGLPEFFMEEA